jgi:hypothetical protein
MLARFIDSLAGGVWEDGLQEVESERAELTAWKRQLDGEADRLIAAAETLLAEKRYIKAGAETILRFISTVEQNAELYRSVDQLFRAELEPMADVRRTCLRMLG